MACTRNFLITISGVDSVNLVNIDPLIKRKDANIPSSLLGLLQPESSAAFIVYY